MTSAVVCKDPECRSHGPMVRRIQRLQRALAAERRHAAEHRRTEIRVRRSLTRTWGLTLDLMMHETLEDGTPVLGYVLATNPNLKLRLKAAMGSRREERHE